MLNVCDPCLIVITRWPRRCSSAASLTSNVVFPACLRPVIASSDGRGMCLGPNQLLGHVDVHECQFRVAVRSDGIERKACHAHVVEERYDSAIAVVEASLDRRH